MRKSDRYIRAEDERTPLGLNDSTPLGIGRDLSLKERPKVAPNARHFEILRVSSKCRAATSFPRLV
jgi:hypothetical protein